MGEELPLILKGEELSALWGKIRGQAVIFYNQGDFLKPDIRMGVPLIVPQDSQGQMIQFKDNTWQHEAISRRDQFFIPRSYVGKPVQKEFKLLGCSPEAGYLFMRPEGVFWVSFCDLGLVDKATEKNSSVEYVESEARIKTNFYDYFFEPENHMLFRKLLLKGKQSKKIAYDSDLYIRSDIKNFFTLNFGKKDILSKMQYHRSESFAQLASLGFFLRVLFFKITLDLRTDVAFFPKAAHIPMVLTLPVNPQKNLNKRSGVFYSFRLAEGASAEKIDSNFPLLTEKLAEDSDLAKLQRVCITTCEFFLKIKDQERSIRMQLSIPEVLASKGLFPWLVTDVRELAKKMKWSLPSDLNLADRIGFYFEISGLTAGSHSWDFWIGFD